jgi:GT2 family glycosyltransferase
MTEIPLVTVNILSYNRKEELRNTLTKVFEQDYKNIEVIVVDNASSDGSPEMVEKEFPSVILIKLDKNIGIAGWNKGFEIAKGEYVLVLDDDSYPEKTALSAALNNIIIINYNVGIVAFNIYNVQKTKFETSFYQSGEVLSFVGCGALIRTSLFKEVGYFSDLFFIYLHEEDFCIRVIDKGYKVIFYPESIVYHLNSLKNRKFNQKKIDHRKYYYGLKNIIIFLFKYFKFTKVFRRIIVIIAGRFLFGIKYNSTIPVFKGVVAFLIRLPILYKKRTLVSENTQKLYKYGKILGGLFYEEENKRLIK